MNSYLNYLLEFNVCVSILGMSYYVLLKGETDFRFRRSYIIIGVLLCLIAPFLKLGSWGYSSGAELNAISTMILPELVIGDSLTSTHTDTPWYQYSFILYGIIAAILLQVFLFQLFQVAWFALSSKTRIQRMKNHWLITTNGTLPTFSFFRLLFLDNSVHMTHDEKLSIINHELAHIRMGHSYDIVLLECIKLFSWFNPIVWYLRHEIQEVHEYQADQIASQGQTPTEYSSLLAKMALSQANLSLGHHFSKSKTLKRIKMINTVKKRITPKKLALLVPVLALTIMVVSCNDEVMKDIDTTMETASQTEVPESLQSKFEELQTANPDADLTYFEADGTAENPLKNLENLDVNTIVFVQVWKEKNKVGVIVNRNGAIKKVATAADENGVFVLVDQPSAPVGGYSEYYQELAQTLLYPKQAREAGVEGKVYVQFIVNPDGSLSDVKAVKGLGAGCDAAAVEAVRSTGSWSSPIQNGKAVKQRIILPITFKLADNAQEGESNFPQTIEIDN